MLAGDISHIFVTRTYDDTNVSVAPHLRIAKTVAGGGEEDCDQPEGSVEASQYTAVGKLGGRRVSPLLGIAQRISVKHNGADFMQTAQLHCPSQVLPKARGLFRGCFSHGAVDCLRSGTQHFGIC